MAPNITRSKSRRSPRVLGCLRTVQTRRRSLLCWVTFIPRICRARSESAATSATEGLSPDYAKQMIITASFSNRPQYPYGTSEEADSLLWKGHLWIHVAAGWIADAPRCSLTDSPFLNLSIYRCRPRMYHLKPVVAARTYQDTMTVTVCPHSEHMI